MADNELVADVDAPGWSEGATLLDDGNTLWSDISDGSEVDAVFDIGGTAIDVLSAVIDPLGGVIGCAVGWAFDHISFLREPVDLLAGDAGSIEASAQTWANVATAMVGARDDYTTALNSLSADKWTGCARDAYQQNAEGIIGSLGGASAAATIEGVIITATGELCAAFRGMIIDWISEFVEKMAIRGLIALANSTWTFGGALAAWVIDLEAEGALLAAKIEDQIAKLMGKAAQILRKIGADGGKLEQIAKKLEKFAKKLETNARDLRKNADHLSQLANKVRTDGGHRTNLRYFKNYTNHVDDLSKRADDLKDAVDKGKNVYDDGSDVVTLGLDPSAENLNTLTKDLSGQGAGKGKEALTKD